MAKCQLTQGANDYVQPPDSARQRQGKRAGCFTSHLRFPQPSTLTPLPRRSAAKAGQSNCKPLTKNLQKSSNFVSHLQTLVLKLCHNPSVTAKNRHIVGHDVRSAGVGTWPFPGVPACRAEAGRRRKRRSSRYVGTHRPNRSVNRGNLRNFTQIDTILH